jgi:hypothetical protein
MLSCPSVELKSYSYETVSPTWIRKKTVYPAPVKGTVNVTSSDAWSVFLYVSIEKHIFNSLRAFCMDSTENIEEKKNSTSRMDPPHPRIIFSERVNHACVAGNNSCSPLSDSCERQGRRE